MQFHLNGFKGADDPLKLQLVGDVPDFQSSLPPEVDVLIVGAGPAGLLLAAQLAQFPDIITRIIESKPGPLEQGQADGLQCRTVEIFQAFDFADKVLKEAYWVNETTFWTPDENGLKRTGRVRDTEEGLSEFPHVILNQARLHGMWLETMKWSPTRLEPSYERKLVDLVIPDRGAVTAAIDHNGKLETVKAKYVVGCDGSRSLVRQKMGLEMMSDFTHQGWGVIDALVVSDFPDLRIKSVIRSATEGSVLLIPREGGYLVRLYIELDNVGDKERIARKDFTPELLVSRAKGIFAPFKLEVKQLPYWSVYEVRQGLTSHFDDTSAEHDVPRVFIAGDACHTHSAKAGQGMNVSMNDAYNLGWKLASVSRGHAVPSLLKTYSQERQTIAQHLIEFDRKIARLSASKSSGDDSEELQDYFVAQGRFMAGLMTAYPPSMITADMSNQHLAAGYKIGERFQSCQVLRLADAKPVQLGHELRADGRWRVIIFGADHAETTLTELHNCCRHMAPWLRHDAAADVDAVVDSRAVLQQHRADLQLDDLPDLLRPRKGVFDLVDYEKVFTDEPSYNFGFGAIFESRKIDRSGCIVVVRPDQYVSGIWPFSEMGAKDMILWFSHIFIT